MKEIKVKFHSEEDDSYNELWQIVGVRKYIARHTFGRKCWYYVCDPLGYRELNYPIPSDTVVVVCDKKGNELFRTSNADESVDFNTPKQEAVEQWNKYRDEQKMNAVVENQSALFFAHWASGIPAGKFNTWLMSFQDPDMYPQANDYAENWIWCHNAQVGDPEILGTYMYLGEEQKIERIRYRHEICGVEWVEYYSGGYFIARDFDDSKIGTMYSEREAKRLITDAIKTNFPDVEQLSTVQQYGWGSLNGSYYQENVRIDYAAEKLLGRNYHRDFVDQLVADELQKSHFYRAGRLGIEDIRKEYPDCVEDNRYMY